MKMFETDDQKKQTVAILAAALVIADVAAKGLPDGAQQASCLERALQLAQAMIARAEQL